MKRITVEILRGLRWNGDKPCKRQVKLFAKTFPKGVLPTAANILKALRAGLDLDWFSEAYLSPLALEEYQKAEATAWEEYKKARVPAWAAYKKATAPALAEYEKAMAKAWAACEKAKAKAKAWAAYEEATAQALARAIKMDARDEARAEVARLRKAIKEALKMIDPDCSAAYELRKAL